MPSKKGNKVVNGLDLRIRPTIFAVAFVHHLDANGEAVDIAPAIEVNAGSRMPGLAEARHMLVYSAVAVYGEMAADSSFRIVEPGNNAFGSINLGVVENDGVDYNIGSTPA